VNTTGNIGARLLNTLFNPVMSSGV